MSNSVIAEVPRSTIWKTSFRTKFQKLLKKSVAQIVDHTVQCRAYLAPHKCSMHTTDSNRRPILPVASVQLGPLNNIDFKVSQEACTVPPNARIPCEVTSNTYHNWSLSHALITETLQTIKQCHKLSQQEKFWLHCTKASFL